MLAFKPSVILNLTKKAIAHEIPAHHRDLFLFGSMLCFG